MLLTTWADVLTQSFQSLAYGLVLFIPNLVVAIIIFIVGWLVGVGLGRLVEQVVKAIRVDDALRAAGLEDCRKACWIQAGFRSVPRLPRKVVLHRRIPPSIA